ncbi:Primosomal protein N' [Gammaproteobacteria bacterium]
MSGDPCLPTMTALTPTSTILHIAVPCPLRHDFDYLPPPDTNEALLVPGVRLLVPFGHTTRIGLLLATATTSRVERSLLPALALLDTSPVLPSEVLDLLRWAADYYHHPIGEVIWSALPACLRTEPPTRKAASRPGGWRLTAAGRAFNPTQLTRAPRQALLLAYLHQHPEGLLEGLNEAFSEGLMSLTNLTQPSTRSLQQKNADNAVLRALRALRERGLVETCPGDEETLAALISVPSDPAEPGPPLSADQQAVTAAVAAVVGFQALLLEGVTGSGKTEVYMEAVRHVLMKGRQALVLVPEIGLTPQLVERFRRRLAAPLVEIHSGLSDSARCAAWRAATDGTAAVVIGTRSAIFTPLPRLGLIVVDEEHDLSFKQWEGFRYHARDLAVVRAQRAQIPVLLGSATPALESLHNARVGRYRHLHLSQRAGYAQPPVIRVMDLRRQSLYHGLAEPLLKVMEGHLERGEQVLVFLNRRGYAPVLLCHQCGWVAGCQRCDARLTFHREEWRLRCHHCGAGTPAPRTCPSCGAVALHPLGAGTERLEQALIERFPNYPLVRIDRDSTRRHGALDALLNEVRNGQARILVGTQMLAKGHDFPEVTLVVVVDVDQGLYGADFRAPERLAQLLVQVAGRAGRADKPGQVLLQTHNPDHPLLHTLLTGGYPAFAEVALAERAQAEWPPYSALALLRAEAAKREPPLTFLREAREQAKALIENETVQIYGPLSAPMERRADRYRAQLLLQASRRTDLQKLLNHWAPILETLPSGRRVLHWSLDVDPIDMF